MKMTILMLGLTASVAAQAGGAFEGFEKPEDLPGAVSMVWTGKEVLADVSGYADLATKRPVSTNDLFWIASNTKAIACALMLREIDKGLVKLDAPVADYLPEWKDIRIKGGKAPKHAPTVREVMGHTAGLAFFPKMPITEFSMRSGETAVIGGLTHTEEIDADDGIPYLRAIPWIGQWIFGSTGKSKVQEDILVFVTVGEVDPEGVKGSAGAPAGSTAAKRYPEGLDKQEVKEDK